MSWVDKLSWLMWQRPSLLTLLCLRLQNYFFFFNYTIIHTFSCSFYRFFNISLRLAPLTHLPKGRKTRKLLPDDTNPLCLARHVPVYAKKVSPNAKKEPYIILSWRRNTAAKSVVPSRFAILSRFSVNSSSFLYKLDFQCIIRNYNFPFCFPVVKTRAKRLQDSQSCLVNKSILQSQIVCFAVLHWLFGTSKHSKRYPERLKSPPQTLFFRPKNLISLS